MGFAVQGGRWYSTTLVMSNGSILVMGGEEGAGGAADPTVEIVPRISGGSTKVSLDFLERTNPNISIHSLIFSLAVTYLLVRFKEPISPTSSLTPMSRVSQ